MTLEQHDSYIDTISYRLSRLGYQGNSLNVLMDEQVDIIRYHRQQVEFYTKINLHSVSTVPHLGRMIKFTAQYFLLY